MKTLFNTLFLLLLVPTMVLANGEELQKYSKQKTIKKAYIVNPDAGIDISNSYGNVYVTTWNEDKIELDILIKVSSDKEDWAVKKLNDIDVDIEALKSLVTAKTTFANGAGKSNTKNNSIEINYTIKIPKNGSVKIYNKYGEIITTDLFAMTNIKCKYGKITMGRLSSSNNSIDIEYCGKSAIDYAKTATISADYSGLSMNDFGNVVLNADYTDIHFRTGDNLKYDCSYGNLKFGNINNLEGTGDYLSIAVNELTNNLKVSTSYSKILVDNIAAKAGNVMVNSDYTTVGLGYNPNYAFDFDIKIKYANLKHDNDLEINTKQETPTSKNYQGYHKKTGANKITIVSEFGNVNLNSNQ
jgi:hypothetical protein